MQAGFKIGDTELMASEGMSSGQSLFKGITLSPNPASDDQARRMFAALGEGGQVRMPPTQTFFSPIFGRVDDQFGVSWMVNHAEAMA